MPQRGANLPRMLSSTLSPCDRVPCSSSCFLLFLLLHSEAMKPGCMSMLTLHLQHAYVLAIAIHLARLLQTPRQQKHGQSCFGEACAGRMTWHTKPLAGHATQ